MRVLIVGAGPVGLTLALALHRQGIAFRQVDRALAPSGRSKALGIQARTLEALDRFCVAEPIRAAGLIPRGLTFHLGRRVAGFDLSQRLHPRFPSMVILPQTETERLLATALTAAGGPPPERGVELFGLDAASGAARLRGADGAEKEARFDHVIGCDGAHSQVRKSAGIAFEGARYEEQFVLADGQAEGLEPERLHLFPGRDVAAFFFPLPGGAWRAVAVLPGERPPPAEGDLAPFQRPGIRFANPVWWSAFGVSHRLASSYSTGRVLLAGDAAHIHSPAGGQGMNLGIQDACALALALPGGAPSLDAWAAARRAVARTVIRRTDLLTGLVLGRHPAVRALRALLLPAVPHLQPLRRRFEGALAGLDYPAIGG